MCSSAGCVAKFRQEGFGQGIRLHESGRLTSSIDTAIEWIELFRRAREDPFATGSSQVLFGSPHQFAANPLAAHRPGRTMMSQMAPSFVPNHDLFSLTPKPA